MSDDTIATKKRKAGGLCDVDAESQSKKSKTAAQIPWECGCTDPKNDNDECKLKFVYEFFASILSPCAPTKDFLVRSYKFFVAPPSPGFGLLSSVFGFFSSSLGDNSRSCGWSNKAKTFNYIVEILAFFPGCEFCDECQESFALRLADLGRDLVDSHDKNWVYACSAVSVYDSLVELGHRKFVDAIMLLDKRTHGKSVAEQVGTLTFFLSTGKRMIQSGGDLEILRLLECFSFYLGKVGLDGDHGPDVESVLMKIIEMVWDNCIPLSSKESESLAGVTTMPLSSLLSAVSGTDRLSKLVSSMFQSLGLEFCNGITLSTFLDCFSATLPLAVVVSLRNRVYRPVLWKILSGCGGRGTRESSNDFVLCVNAVVDPGTIVSGCRPSEVTLILDRILSFVLFDQAWKLGDDGVLMTGWKFASLALFGQDSSLLALTQPSKHGGSDFTAGLQFELIILGNLGSFADTKLYSSFLCLSLIENLVQLRDDNQVTCCREVLIDGLHKILGGFDHINAGCFVDIFLRFGKTYGLCGFLNLLGRNRQCSPPSSDLDDFFYRAYDPFVLVERLWLSPERRFLLKVAEKHNLAPVPGNIPMLLIFVTEMFRYGAVRIRYVTDLCSSLSSLGADCSKLMCGNTPWSLCEDGSKLQWAVEEYNNDFYFFRSQQKTNPRAYFAVLSLFGHLGIFKRRLRLATEAQFLFRLFKDATPATFDRGMELLGVDLHTLENRAFYAMAEFMMDQPLTFADRLLGLIEKKRKSWSGRREILQKLDGRGNGNQLFEFIRRIEDNDTLVRWLQCAFDHDLVLQLPNMTYSSYKKFPYEKSVGPDHPQNPDFAFYYVQHYLCRLPLFRLLPSLKPEKAIIRDQRADDDDALYLFQRLLAGGLLVSMRVKDEKDVGEVYHGYSKLNFSDGTSNLPGKNPWSTSTSSRPLVRPVIQIVPPYDYDWGIGVYQQNASNLIRKIISQHFLVNDDGFRFPKVFADIFRPGQKTWSRSTSYQTTLNASRSQKEAFAVFGMLTRYMTRCGHCGGVPVDPAFLFLVLYHRSGCDLFPKHVHEMKSTFEILLDHLGSLNGGLLKCLFSRSSGPFSGSSDPTASLCEWLSSLDLGFFEEPVIEVDRTFVNVNKVIEPGKPYSIPEVVGIAVPAKTADEVQEYLNRYFRASLVSAELGTLLTAFADGMMLTREMCETLFSVFLDKPCLYTKFCQRWFAPLTIDVEYWKSLLDFPKPVDANNEYNGDPLVVKFPVGNTMVDGRPVLPPFRINDSGAIAVDDPAMTADDWSEVTMEFDGDALLKMIDTVAAWFDDYIDNLDEEGRKRLLKFYTSRTTLPVNADSVEQYSHQNIGGLPDHIINVEVTDPKRVFFFANEEDPSTYPNTSTCFSKMNLPVALKVAWVAEGDELEFSTSQTYFEKFGSIVVDTAKMSSLLSRAVSMMSFSDAISF